MDRMSPLDAAFLHLEDGINHLHIASCAVFEGPAPTVDELRRLIAGKLPLVPRYRQRVRFVPLQLGRPVWVDAPDFRVDDHVFRVALPEPGDDGQLHGLMAWLMELELDRDRPLWESWLVEGLAGGRWAIISKVHHCMVDGVGGVDLLTLLLDVSPEPSAPVADDWVPQPAPSGLSLAGRSLVESATAPVAAAARAAGAVRHPGTLHHRARDVVAGLGSYASQLRPAPPSSASGLIGPHRSWTVARVTLDDVREVRRSFGGTVNDVVLTAVAGGFRALLLEHGEDVDHAVVRTLVPVNVRSDDERGRCTNLVSAMFAELPVAQADAVDRLAAVRAGMARTKASHQVDAGRALTSAAAAFPPLLVTLAERAAIRFADHVPQHSVATVTTNVPGPPMPLYAAGRRMLEYLPYVPVAQGVRVGVAVLSYDGLLAFGVTGDRSAAGDVRTVAGGIESTVADLVARTAHLAPA